MEGPIIVESPFKISFPILETSNQEIQPNLQDWEDIWENLER